MATGADIPEPVSSMEREGVIGHSTPGDFNQPPGISDNLLQSENLRTSNIMEVHTVLTGFKGNAGVLEGESFLESSSISEVSGEEIFRKHETCLAGEIMFQAEKEISENRKDKRSEAAEETRLKQNEVEPEKEERNRVDATGNNLQMERTEKPIVKDAEDETSEERISECVEAIENGQGLVEESRNNADEENTTSQNSKEEGKKINENDTPDTNKEVSILETNADQPKEPTPDPTFNNMDTAAETETIIEACPETESKGNASSTKTTIIEEKTREDCRVKEQVPGTHSGFFDEVKDPDEIKPIEETKMETESKAQCTIGEATSIQGASPDIQEDKETNSKFRGVEEKLDMLSVTPATDLSSINEAASMEGNKLERTSSVACEEESPESISRSEDVKGITPALEELQEKNIVNTPATQTEEIYLKNVNNSELAGANSEIASEDTVKKSPQEEGQTGLFEKTSEDDDGEVEKVEDKINTEEKLDSMSAKNEEAKESTAEEASAGESMDNSEHTVIMAEDNINDEVTIAGSEHNKVETSKQEKNTAINESEKEIDTTVPTECAETIASAKGRETTESQEESFEEEEKSTNADATGDAGKLKEENLPPKDWNDKTENEELEMQNKNTDDLHIRPSLEQQTLAESQEKLQEVTEASKDEEKNVEIDLIAWESTNTTTSEPPSAEGKSTTEGILETSETVHENVEKVPELEAEDKLEIEDAGRDMAEEMQRKEEACKTQTHEVVTSHDSEKCEAVEVISAEAHDAILADKKDEERFQESTLEEATITLKNENDKNDKTSNIDSEQVHEEPNTIAVGVINVEQNIESDVTHILPEGIKEETAQSSQDTKKVAEMSKEEEISEQSTEENYSNGTSRESIEEKSVKNIQDYENDTEKSSREIPENPKTEKTVDSVGDDEIQNDEGPNSVHFPLMVKEHASLPNEILPTSEVEEKIESSIEKNEEGKNEVGLADVSKKTEKEMSKDEEDSGQILHKNEREENDEQTKKAITAEVEVDSLSKMDEEKLDMLSVTPATDLSSINEAVSMEGNKLEGTSSVACKEESPEPISISEDVKGITPALEELQEKNTVNTPATQTEEICLKNVNNLEIAEANSEIASEDTVKKSPQEEGQTGLFEKTSESDDGEVEKVEDKINTEEKLDSMSAKNEEAKGSTGEEASAGKSMDNGKHTVIMAEDNINDEVTIAGSEHKNVETSKQEKNTAITESEREIDTSVTTECAETIASAKGGETTESQEERFEEEEKSTNADDTTDAGMLKKENLLPKDWNEKTENEELEMQTKNTNDFHISPLLEQQTLAESQEKLQEVTEASKDEEKNVEIYSKAWESTNATTSEPPSAEGKSTTEGILETSETVHENVEKVPELEAEDEIEIEDAGRDMAEKMQRKEEACKTQIHEVVTSHDSGKCEAVEVISVEAHDAILADKKVEERFQESTLEEAAITLKNENDRKDKTSNIDSEQVHEEPNKIAVGVINVEQNIESDVTHILPEGIKEDTAQSSQDTKKVAEMSKEEEISEQSTEENYSNGTSRESIGEEPVKNIQDYENDTEKSSREIPENPETEKIIDSVADDEIQNEEGPNSAHYPSMVKEHENLQYEVLPTSEVEEKIESSIGKNEASKNDDGLADVSKNTQKEMSKDEEDSGQILHDSEPEETEEQTKKALIAEVEEDSLSKMDDKQPTVQSPQDTEKEGEMEKEEDTEEQILIESNTESQSQEYIKQDPKQNIQNDENNAEELSRKIIEGAEPAKTYESVAHKAKEDGESATSPTQLVEGAEYPQDEGKGITPAEALAEERTEEDLSLVKAGENDESFCELAEANKNCDKEASEAVDDVAHEKIQTGEEHSSNQQLSLAKEQENPEIVNATPAETSTLLVETGETVEMKSEEDVEQISKNEPGENLEKSPAAISAEADAGASYELADVPDNITIESAQDTAKTTEVPKEEQTEGCIILESNTESLTEETTEQTLEKNFQEDEKNADTLENVKSEQNVENVLKNEQGESLEQSTAATCTETEVDASYEVGDIPRNMANESRQDNANVAEITKEDQSEGFIIQVTNAKNLAEETTEETPEKHFQESEKNTENTNREIFEESDTATVHQSIEHETNKNDESSVVTLITSQVKEEANLYLSPAASKEEKKEDDSSVKAAEDDNNNAGPPAANESTKKETTEIKEDSEYDLQKTEPREIPEESSNAVIPENDASTLSEKPDYIASLQEVEAVKTAEETAAEEKKEEEVEDAYEIKVKKVASEEYLVPVAETSETNKSLEKENVEEKPITDEMEVEISEKTEKSEVEKIEKLEGLDSMEKTELKDMTENIEEETKQENMKQFFENPEKYIIAEETGMDISAQCTREETTKDKEAEERSKEINEELVITSIDQHTEKQVPKEENVKNNQATEPTGEVASEDEITVQTPKEEVPEIIQTPEKNEDIAGNIMEEASVSENISKPLVEVTDEKDPERSESDVRELKEGVKDSNSEVREETEASSFIEANETETFKEEEKSNDNLNFENASEEGTFLKESSKSLDQVSTLESETKELLEKEGTKVEDPVCITREKKETSLNEDKPEEKLQTESSDLASTEKELVLDTRETTMENTDIDASDLVGDSNSVREDTKSTSSLEANESETLKEKEESNDGLYPENASKERKFLKESSESLVVESTLESENKEVIEKEGKKVDDPVCIRGEEKETFLKEDEPEDKGQREKSDPASAEKELVTDTRETILKNVAFGTKIEETSHLVDCYSEIPAPDDEAEAKIEHEIQKEAPTAESENPTESSDFKDEPQKCIGSINADRNEVILEEQNSTKFAATLKEDLTVEEEPITEVEAGSQNQELEAPHTKTDGALTEENLEKGESAKDHEFASKFATRDLSKETIPGTSSIEVEDNRIDIQNESSESFKQSQKSQEGKQESQEKTEQKSEPEDFIKETQSKNENVTDIDTKPEDACALVDYKDHQIRAEACKAKEEIEHEVQSNKCIHPTSKDEKEATPEEEDSAKNSDANLQEGIAAEKELAVELEAGTNNQELEANSTENCETPREESIERDEHSKKDELVPQTTIRDLSRITAPETNLREVKDNKTDIRSQNSELLKQSQEYPEVQQETEEKTEPISEAEDHSNETSSENEIVKAIILTKEEHEEVEKADANETIEPAKEEEVEESRYASSQYLKPTDSNKYTEVASSEFQEAQNMETEEKTEPISEAEDHSNETSSENEIVKAIILTKEEHEEVEKADANETIEPAKEKEVEESSYASSQYLKPTDSNKYPEVASSEVQEAQNMKKETSVPDIIDEKKVDEAVEKTDANETVKPAKEEEVDIKELHNVSIKEENETPVPVVFEEEKVEDKEVEKADAKEEEVEKKELHSVSITDKKINEVKDSSNVSSEYFKATDSKEHTEVASSEVQEAQTMEKEMSVLEVNEEKKVKDEEVEKADANKTVEPAKEEEDDISIKDEKETSASEVIEEEKVEDEEVEKANANETVEPAKEEEVDKKELHNVSITDKKVDEAEESCHVASEYLKAKDSNEHTEFASTGVQEAQTMEKEMPVLEAKEEKVEDEEVETADANETVEPAKEEEADITERHTVSIENEKVNEVEESSYVLSKYLKATDFNEDTEVASSELREEQTMEKETSVSEAIDEEKVDEAVEKANANKTVKPAKEEEVDVKELHNASIKDENETSVPEVIEEEKVEDKEVEKADANETIEPTKEEEVDIKALHNVSIKDEKVDEVKESSYVASKYLKATDSNEHTEFASSEVQEAQTMEKETSAPKVLEEEKVEDEEVGKADADETVKPAKEEEVDIKELHTVSIEDEKVNEAEESSYISSKYLKATDFNEDTVVASSEVQEEQTIEKETSEIDKKKVDKAVKKADASETVKPAKEEEVDIKELHNASVKDENETSAPEVIKEEKVEDKEVEKADTRGEEVEIKELQSVSIKDEKINEVKDSSHASSEYFKATDSKEHTEVASSEVQEAQTMEKEMSVLEVNEEKKVKDDEVEKVDANKTFEPAKEEEVDIKELQNASIKDGKEMSVSEVIEEDKVEDEEVEKADANETVEPAKEVEVDIKELHNVSIKDEKVDEVEESSYVASKNLKATDSNEHTEFASSEVQEAQTMVKETSAPKVIEEKKVEDGEVEKADADETVKPAKEEEVDIKELHTVSFEDEKVNEVKESSYVSSRYLKATDFNEDTEVATSEVQEEKTMEKKKSIPEAIEKKKVQDEGSEKLVDISTITSAEESEQKIKKDVISNEADSCHDDIKTSVEELAETSLEVAEVDEKLVQVSNIMSDAICPHPIEAEASQLDQIVESEALKTDSSKSTSEVQDDDHENVMEESKKPFDIYESNDRGVEELQKGGIRGEIKEASETVSKSEGIKMVTGSQHLPEEISEEQHPTPSSELPSKEKEYSSKAAVHNGVGIIKDENSEDTSTSETTEQTCLQKEEPREIKVSELGLQPKDDMPVIPNKEQKEEVGSIEEIKEVTKEETIEASEAVAKSGCQSLEADTEDELAGEIPSFDDEKSEEQYEASSCEVQSKDQKDGSSSDIKKIENITKELKVPEQTTKETSLQKEEPRELEVPQLDFEQKEDANETPNAAHQEAGGPSEGIGEKNAALQSVSTPIFDGTKAVKEDENIVVETLNVEKTVGQNQTSPSAVERIEENTKEVKMLEDIPKPVCKGQDGDADGTKELEEASEFKSDSQDLEAVETKDVPETTGDTSLQKEVPREIEVLQQSLIAKDIQEESVKEEYEGQRKASDETEEEIKGTTKSVSRSDSQGFAEEEDEGVQAILTEKSEEKNQKPSAVVLPKSQDYGAASTVDDIAEYVKEVEAPFNEDPLSSSASKTIEEMCMEKEAANDLGISRLETENRDTEKQSPKEVHSEEGTTACEASELKPQQDQNNIEDAECPAQREKITEFTGTPQTTSNLGIQTSGGAFQNVLEAPDQDVLAESEPTEIREKHLKAEIGDLIAGEITSKKMMDTTEIIQQESTREEVKEESEDAKKCRQMALGKEITQESHQKHEIWAEECLEENRTVKDIQKEEVYKQIERSDESKTTKENIRTVEHQDQEAIQHETSTRSSLEEAEGMNVKDAADGFKADSPMFGDDSFETTTVIKEESRVEASHMKDSASLAEAKEIAGEICQQGRTSDETSEKETLTEAKPCVMKETMIDPKEMPDLGFATSLNSEVKEVKNGADKTRYEQKEISAKVSLFDIMERSKRERKLAGDLTEEKELQASQEELKVKTEKVKSDEEKEAAAEQADEEEEHQKIDTGSDAPVMVEAYKDMDVKVAHKKSHNILSGVGSKVKHSISKVKKAITGKSSHSKQHSPK